MTINKEVVNLSEIKDFIDDENYLVVIDSCVFLDYYRYSSETAKAILNNLEFLKENLWIPNQVFKEFHKNYNAVFTPNHNKYKNITTKITSYTRDAENKFNDLLKEYNKYNFPKVKELNEKISEHLKEINKEAEQYKVEIKKEMDDMKVLFKDNAMLTFINQLKKNNHVGAPLSSNSLLEIAEEGKRRFDLNLPPGYEDLEKIEGKKNVDPLAPYGDLIVWKSIIHKAKEDNVNIIFTTSDSKEDWWHLDENNNILYPREELIAEFNEETEVKSSILMIPMKEFISKFSLISNISSLYSNVELNANEILQDRLYESGEEIKEILIADAYHVHLGNIEDVEDFEIINVKIEDSDVEFDDERVNLSTEFQIDASGYFVEYINKGYSQSTQITIILKGTYSVEIELDAENEDYSIDDWEFTDLSIVDSKIHYDEDYYEIQPWEYCVVCMRKTGDHELYPDERICNSCSQNSDFILCTNCGTFYKHEDYTGDGQYCGKCREKTLLEEPSQSIF